MLNMQDSKYPLFHAFTNAQIMRARKLCSIYPTRGCVGLLGILTKPWFYGFVILSEAKNLSLYGLIQTLRFAQGDMAEVLLERLSLGAAD